MLGCYGAHVRELPTPRADRACGQAGDVPPAAGEWAYALSIKWVGVDGEGFIGWFMAARGDRGRVQQERRGTIPQLQVRVPNGDFCLLNACLYSL